jgi:diguanylate cyclase (GGDEF)-like protein
LLDWGKLPDVGAVALLTCAFASVARRGYTAVSRLWLTGWIFIEVHFTAYIFLSVPGILGSLALFIGLTALAGAGLMFMWACVPYRNELSSRWLLGVLSGSTTLYIALLCFASPGSWAFVPSAALFGILPVTLALLALRKFRHPLRWAIVTLYLVLSVFLLVFQHRPGNGQDLALEAVLFTVYFGCTIHFWFAYRRAATVAFIAISGFLAWALVFVISPGVNTFFPNLHLESEVWNLPKYVVAVGMILLLLEDQIEHNKYLALHDELTGLPNLRLFEDRLNGALERARRTGTIAALLLVDLDRFKEVNDTVGHHVGDLLLIRVGELFQGRVRRTDTVARTGGDEFSIILEEPVSRDDAERVGLALMQLLNEPIAVGGHSVRVGASVGIAVFPEDASNSESLRIAADLRMYGAKNAAKGGPRVKPALHPISAPFPAADPKNEQSRWLRD